LATYSAAHALLSYVDLSSYFRTDFFSLGRLFGGADIGKELPLRVFRQTNLLAAYSAVWENYRLPFAFNPSANFSLLLTYGSVVPGGKPKSEKHLTFLATSAFSSLTTLRSLLYGLLLRTINYANHQNGPRLLHRHGKLGVLIRCQVRKVGTRPLASVNRFRSGGLNKFTVRAEQHSTDKFAGLRYLDRLDVCAPIGQQH